MQNFRVNVVIRIIFILLTVVLLDYLYRETDLTATLIVLFLILVSEIIAMIKYIDTTNKELTRFILSIKHSDFSQTFVHKRLGHSFENLNLAFNDVMEKFRNTRNEKEEHLRYLQTVMQHVGVGLLSYNQLGDVEFINNAAKKILGVPYLKNIISLNHLADQFGTTLLQLRAGDKTTIKIIDKDDLVQLLIYTTEFKLRNQNYKLVSLQNIQSELEEQEMEAWQRLIRVLTHEIMNSITPISSLAETVNHMLSTSDEDHKDIETETISDIKNAVNTIHKRSEGLINFVNNYRNLTKIPKPNFKIISINDLFDNITKLMISRIEEQRVKFTCFVEPKTLELTADPELIEQVIINLIINSLHALQQTVNPELVLNAQLNTRGKIVIRVVDNGPGIPEDVIDKIFIPFYSTKKDGSGIGLSLSRQIIRAHGGNIRVTSKPNIETAFTLRF